ncbi:MAG TPA: MFS transporter [Gemmatimonas sp.]|nr:MFS transporter [Gemmatimonas sp.]
MIPEAYFDGFVLALLLAGGTLALFPKTRGVLARVGTMEKGEGRSTLMAATYFFFALASYFILRAVRDAVGVAAGTGQLPWLFLGTAVTTLAMNPVYATIVSRLPVRRFIPIVYRVFIGLLLLFAAIVRWGPPSIEPFVGPTFWILTSVYNLFITSVFWSFMADTFRPEQSKRLFGFISVGGTLGALAGSRLTGKFAEDLGTPMLMVLSVLFLECAVQAVRRFPPSFRAETRERDASQRSVGGGSFAGITNVLKSPYMLGICVYMLMFTIGSTVLYFQQAEIVGARYSDREQRTAFLADLDFITQGLTLLAQLFITGRVIKWLGVGLTLAILPLVSTIGFASLGIWGSLGLFVVFQVARRAGEYAFGRPAREVLFTVVPPEDKYKAKNFIDLFVYRTGDQIGAWSYSGLQLAGLAVSSIALIAAPMSLVWLGVALWLGRQCVKRQANEPTDDKLQAIHPAAGKLRADGQLQVNG